MKLLDATPLAFEQTLQGLGAAEVIAVAAVSRKVSQTPPSNCTREKVCKKCSGQQDPVQGTSLRIQGGQEVTPTVWS